MRAALLSTLTSKQTLLLRPSRSFSVAFRSRSRCQATAAFAGRTDQHKSEPAVVVIGGGIIGLSTAQELLTRGHRVITVTKSDTPQRTTSSVAAGFVFPYLLQPISKCEEWVKLTLEHCRNPPQPGLISPMKAYAIHIEERIQGDPEWNNCGLDYRRMDKGELEEFNMNRRGWFPAVDGFAIDTFCINTPAYLEWLVREVEGMGGEILSNKEFASLMDVAADPDIRSRDTGIKALVNCTGVYARNLVDDQSLFPMYGQVISLKPQQGINTGYVVEDGSELMGGHTYMFPREDKIICGGTAIADKWSEKPESEITQGIIQRVKKLVPDLQIDESLIEDVRCGLRPARPELRLEAEPDHLCGIPVVHSYGHGGSGWTVFRGAARDAVNLVETVCD